MAADNSKATLCGLPLSMVSLVTLAVQNAILILVMHYSRIMPLVNGQRYFTSTAVFLNEVIKLAISAVIAFRDTSKNLPHASSATVTRALYNQAFSSDSWKLAIPAALYTFQNSLQYIAVSNLDAATFQVTYQLKILTTALFSVTMLKRNLQGKQWASLLLLMAGVAIVSVLPSGSSSKAGHKVARDSKASVVDHMNPSLGLIAVITACATSGLAGVYFEKVLKDGAKVTLWVRNVQLSFYSIFPAFFIGVVFKDGAAIQEAGFFSGYNNWVWAAIICQAVGGLLVALVVNYADNIAKNFATSISILLSCIASIYFFDFEVTINFLLGMMLVLFATYLYSSPSPRPAPTGEPPSEYRRQNSIETKETASMLEKGALGRLIGWRFGDLISVPRDKAL